VNKQLTSQRHHK